MYVGCLPLPQPAVHDIRCCLGVSCKYMSVQNLSVVSLEQCIVTKACFQNGNSWRSLGPTLSVAFMMFAEAAKILPEKFWGIDEWSMASLVVITFKLIYILPMYVVCRLCAFVKKKQKNIHGAVLHSQHSWILSISCWYLQWLMI